jgi:L-threonylcarbamoyladenylate synthase
LPAAARPLNEIPIDARLMSLSCTAIDLADRLRSGEAVLFPTDTLPALASRPEHARQLWEVKQRPQHKPLILMGASAADLWDWLDAPPQPAWQELAERHWPGGLTLVVPAARHRVEALHPGGDSIGLRVPACAEALALLRLSGPLATTSANRSGEEPCLSAGEAAQRFPEIARLGPEPWPAPLGQASTVLRWCPPGRWQILRHGAVTL